MDDDKFPKLPPPGVVTIGEPEFVGRVPVRQELTVRAEPPGPSYGELEWKDYGNCVVYAFNGGPLDKRWRLVVGGWVLIRAKAGGWFMTDLERDKKGWFARVGDKLETRVPIVWSGTRGAWVSTVQV